VSVVDQLAAYGRRAVASGLVIGSGGNLSAREPGADVVWVTAAGTWLDELGPGDFSLVGVEDGQVREGSPRPSTEVQLHLHAYRARPDVNAVLHLHPQTSVLLDAMGHEIRLVTTDHAAYVGEIRSTPCLPTGTAEIAEAAAAAVRDGCDCVILGHHGCMVVADTAEMAFRRAVNLEQAAKATYAALVLGGPVPRCPDLSRGHG
jgi:L-fuculose-phosphate aldolase